MAELLGLRKAPSGAAAARQRARCGSLLDQVAASLDAYGYAVLDNYVSEGAWSGWWAEWVGGMGG